MRVSQWLRQEYAADVVITLTGPGCLIELKYHKEPVAPVAYQVILEPGIGQFRELETRRVHTRINSLRLFLVHELTCGKRESVS